MKVPLDLLLHLIMKMLDDLDIQKISEKLKRHLESPEISYEEVANKIPLAKIIKRFIKEDEEVRKMLKEKMREIKGGEEGKKERKVDEEKENLKEEVKLTKKKRERTLSSNTNHSVEKKTKKKYKKDDDIDLEKELDFLPKPKGNSNPDRTPFQRIKSNISKIPDKLKDNSYAAYMRQSGNDFGAVANEKLIHTRGKGFKKEKTKFKNKTFHGGMHINTAVQSIKLDVTSSDEE